MKSGEGKRPAGLCGEDVEYKIYKGTGTSGLVGRARIKVPLLQIMISYGVHYR